MKKPERRQHQKIVALIASLELTVILLLFLIILVVWGTLYQVDNGIYAAQERFFNAWFTTISGIFPFPAVKTIISILFLNLVAAFIKQRKFSITTAGMFTIHIGVALLVIGSALSSGFVREAAITLGKGQSSSTVYDFTSWKLTLVISGTEGSEHYQYAMKNLHVGQTIKPLPDGPVIRISQILPNCGAMIDKNDNKTITSLKKLPSDGNNERNIPGISLFLNDNPQSDNTTSALHHIYAGFEEPVILSSGKYSFAISLLPFSMELPLRLRLEEFEATWHTGTSKAKSFKSKLHVLGKNIDREVILEMNRPFRFGTFTFYQMGYSGKPGDYLSTIAIVKNPFKYMPYLSSIIIVTGLFLHFFVKMWHTISSNGGIQRDKN